MRREYKIALSSHFATLCAGRTELSSRCEDLSCAPFKSTQCAHDSVSIRVVHTKDSLAVTSLLLVVATPLRSERHAALYSRFVPNGAALSAAMTCAPRVANHESTETSHVKTTSLLLLYASM